MSRPTHAIRALLALVALPLMVRAPGAAAQSEATVVFKLLDDSGASANGSSLFALDADVGPVNAELLTYLASDVWPRISVDVVVLQALREEAAARSGQRAVDMTQYFAAKVAPANADDLVAALLALDIIERAYVQPGGDSEPCDPENDGLSHVADQDYRADAPAGVGANAVQTSSGSRGACVRITDIEWLWNVSQVDLCGRIQPANPTWDPSVPLDPLHQNDHGTAVLGILAADDDDHGVTGIANEAMVNVVTLHPDVLPSQPDPDPNIEDAIARAAPGLVPGDVLLLEVQSPQCGHDFMPVEVWPLRYDWIRQTAQRGIHVVEAAGNRGTNLDAYLEDENCVDQTPRFIHDHTLVEVMPGVWEHKRDSLAIIVGAGNLANPAEQIWSSWGVAIDAYSHGEEVDTLGHYRVTPCHSHLEPNDTYTCSFNGSSSASAIVAGCVAVLSGKHEELHGPYRPEAMRLMLRTSGTLPKQDPPELIGRQPNLVDQLAIIAMGPEPGHVFTGLERFEPRAGLTTRGPFGEAVASIDDINADGVRELLVGAPSDNSASFLNAGALYVFSGLTGALLRTCEGEELNAALGNSIATGRVNLDQIDDYAVGARGDESVYVFNGATGNPIYSRIAPIDVEEGSNFGWSVAMGDLDGDGKADIAVGAPQWNGHGAVFVFSGADGLEKWRQEGEFANELLGRAVAIRRETSEADAFLVAGAPGFDAGRGRIGAWAWSGTGPGGTWTFAALTLGGAQGEALGDAFGEALTTFDMLGAGYDVVAVGAPLNDYDGLDFGEVKIYSSGVTPIRRIGGTATGAGFGKRLANAGNFNGDVFSIFSPRALEDLLVASPDAGKVRIFTSDSSSSAPSPAAIGAASSTTATTSGTGSPSPPTRPTSSRRAASEPARMAPRCPTPSSSYTAPSCSAPSSHRHRCRPTPVAQRARA